MKQLVILLLSMLSFSAVAQEPSYRPFIEEGKVWISKPLVDLTQAGIKPQQILEYNYFQGDTVIAGKRCKKWIIDYRNMEGNTLLSCFVSMFEEKKKVWFFFKGENEPRLAYDFGAKEGDTLCIFSPNAYYYDQFKEYGILNQHMDSFVDTIVIHSKSEKKLLGECRSLTYFYSIKRNNIDKKDDFLTDNYLLSGIGTHWGPENNLMWVGQNMGRHSLIYCIKGDSILYADEEKASYWGISRPTSLSPSTVVNGRSAQKDASHLKKCFDLTGRRLVAPPKKGIYIEDGRKKAGSQER